MDCSFPMTGGVSCQYFACGSWKCYLLLSTTFGSVWHLTLNVHHCAALTTSSYFRGASQAKYPIHAALSLCCALQSRSNFLCLHCCHFGAKVLHGHRKKSNNKLQLQLQVQLATHWGMSGWSLTFLWAAGKDFWRSFLWLLSSCFPQNLLCVKSCAWFGLMLI